MKGSLLCRPCDCYCSFRVLQWFVKIPLKPCTCLIGCDSNFEKKKGKKLIKLKNRTIYVQLFEAPINGVVNPKQSSATKSKGHILWDIIIKELENLEK